MIDAYFNISFILIMLMVGAIFVIFIPLLFVQHFLHKKLLDPVYFNSHYYSQYELEIFNTFPLMFIKTLGYIKAIALPSKMRRKFVEDILNRRDHPAIYSLAILTLLILLLCTLIIINTGIVGLFIYFNPFVSG